MNKKPDDHVLDVLTSEEAHRLAELEAIVDEGEPVLHRMAQAINEIIRKKLYRTWRGTPEVPVAPGKQATVEQYLQGRFKISRTHGYRLSALARVTDALSPIGYTPSEPEARVLSGMDPEDMQLVARVVQAITGSNKPSPSQVKAVADVVKALDAVGTVEDPDTGNAVRLSELTPERRVAIIAENVTTSTFERIKRQENHIREKQGSGNAPTPSVGDTLANLGQKLTPDQILAVRVKNNGQGVKFQTVLLSEDGQVLAEGEPKNWLRDAVNNYIEEVKHG